MAKIAEDHLGIWIFSLIFFGSALIRGYLFKHKKLLKDISFRSLISCFPYLQINLISCFMMHVCKIYICMKYVYKYTK